MLKTKIMKKLIWITLLFFVSCKAASGIDEEKTFILIDGEKVEMVSDEYGNQYLKYRTYGPVYIYVPFPFETEEVGDTLHSYEAKIK
jgi:hypothetical protein